jgi:dihydroorotate dehydrogenase electron transfer subunit
MWIEAPNIACAVLPGQFITVRCRDFTLRRPFSIHQVSSQEIALLFKVAGKGTLWLSQRQKGDRIDILGPLGEGFSIPPTKSGQSKHLLLVAGGIGIAPFVFLMQYASSQHQITLIHGASTAAQLYPSAMPKIGPSSPSKKRSKLSPLPNGVQFIPVTEVGSMGQKGMATDILPDFLDWADQVYACGPLEMYAAMAEMSRRAKQSNLKLTKCQVSLEVRMGCGFGACYGCTINTKKGLKQVCRDGPVFELDDIIWQEVRI